MIKRRHAAITGILQGVGFRPFVVRLAQQLGLSGFVQNCAGSVTLEIEGPTKALDQFTEQFIPLAPPHSEISTICWTYCPPQNSSTFHIIESRSSAGSALVTPVDLAPCPACIDELNDPNNRRFQYPFMCCVDCGPRFSMIRSTPFDRRNTSMDEFPLCCQCEEEYCDSDNRRFHAQGICCATCGPTLTFCEPEHTADVTEHDPLKAAVNILRTGKILALKGVGGYQLIVAANNPQAITKLRQQKRRPDKPFALMFADVKSAREYTALNEQQAQTLSGPAAPIVLLQAQGRALPESIAPDNPMLGVMLPTSPLHSLLAEQMAAPLVITSGNVHGEPIITDDAEAQNKLVNIADAFLSHNREIVHAVDDSVVQLVNQQIQLLRFARGFAPRSFPMANHSQAILATGGHLKQSPVLLADDQAVCWPQLGDLDSWPARRAMSKNLQILPEFLHQQANLLATDLHPDYATSLWAEQDPRPTIAVQHHHAHVAACLAEHEMDEALGVAWDGAGYGADGTSWGGEFLHVTPAGYQRVANLRPFPLPGGEAVARNGWRVLAGLCSATEQLPDPIPNQIKPYLRLAQNRAVCPQSSSVGRLFDAVAALSGLCPQPSFEGQAAMAVQHAAQTGAQPYSFDFENNQLDWRPMLPEMFADADDACQLASRFHATLVAMVLAVVAARQPKTVALCGGCFQNKLLLESCYDALVARGYRVIFPQQLPPGDGGLALGQAWVANHTFSQTNQ